MDSKAIFRTVETRSDWIRTTLQEFVLQESPSENRATVNAAMAIAERHALELGGRARWHKQKDFGDVLALRFGPRGSSRKSLLLLGHLDTVWPVGTLAGMPWREEKGRYWGPGVLDMKAGVVMALAAISTLRELKLARPVTLLLNSEEEVGSPVSRGITEKLALE